MRGDHGSKQLEEYVYPALVGKVDKSAASDVLGQQEISAEFPDGVIIPEFWSTELKPLRKFNVHRLIQMPMQVNQSLSASIKLHSIAVKMPFTT